MCRTIWKFTLRPGVKVQMPLGSKILTVAAQGQSICVWAEVDSNEAQEEEREIKVYGTGHDLPENHHELQYIGTAFLGSMVFHVYETAFPCLRKGGRVR